MKKNSLVSNITNSAIFLGVTTCMVMSANTSGGILPINTAVVSSYDVGDNCKHAAMFYNNSEMLKNETIFSKGFDSIKSGSVLLENNINSRKVFKVEDEARMLFGEMREATFEEQQRLENNIKARATYTGVDFWDYA